MIGTPNDIRNHRSARHGAAASCLLAVAAILAIGPGPAFGNGARISRAALASASSGQTTPSTGSTGTPSDTTGSTSAGGTNPGTTKPPVLGVPAMDAATGWVFPIKQVGGMLSPSSWSLDQGVDLGGTSSFCGTKATLVAVDDAVVVGIGISGFGPKSPILRLARGPLKGRYVYYGHSQPTIVKKGDFVHRGQAISSIGCGIVGISSAPHLEIGIYSRGSTYCCPGNGETSPGLLSVLKRMWPKAIQASRARRS
jgi:murein DD-endopeptidase MepM/ murein hydrolase activator NlpD